MMMNNNENSGYKVFLKLQYKDNPSKDYVSVESVPFSDYHKIGISSEGYPLFFVKCDNQTKSIDINLELISVVFSQECSIKENEKNSNEIYTVVILKTINTDLQQYFTDVFSIILQQLEPIPSENNLYREIRKVIDLFSSISKTPVKSIQGLWAELLVIEKSSDPEYLINAWHNSPSDKYDFNDSIDKLEVKSTTKSKRIHRFSIEQLNNIIVNDLIKYNPRECILSHTNYNDASFLKLLKTNKNINIYPYIEWEFYTNKAEQFLKNHFSIKDMQAIPITNKVMQSVDSGRD
jgi:hypothetical protein